MNKDLLDFAGVETFRIAKDLDIFVAASLVGSNAGNRQFLARIDRNPIPRDVIQMGIAKTLILSGRYDWEQFGIAMNVAMAEYDREERRREAKWRASEAKRKRERAKREQARRPKRYIA